MLFPSNPSRFPSSAAAARPWFDILRAAISSKSLRLGQCAHAAIIICGLSPNRFLTNNLITVYSKCNLFSYARQLFDRIPDRDLVTWNSILAGCAFSPETGQEGLRLFHLMRRSAVSPSWLTLAPVLKICLHSGLLDTSEAVHSYSVKIGLDGDSFVSAALVNIHAKFGRIENARCLFDEMCDRDVVLWNIIIKAYMQLGFESEAVSLFSELHCSELKPDDVSVQCILGGASKKVYVEQVQAYAVKTCLVKEDLAVIGWNKTMTRLLQVSNNVAVIECFIEMMRSNVGYDNVTFVIVLTAIAGINDLNLGNQIHSMIIKIGQVTDIPISNNLIHIYTKASCLDQGRKMFDEMVELDLVSWNSMISGYVQHGRAEEAIALFLSLLCNCVLPDQFTLASILRASSAIAAGSILGKQVHALAVKTGHFADVFVLTSLINAYVKNSKMEEAESVFHTMDGFNSGCWNAMMAGYLMSDESVKSLNLFSLISKNGGQADEFILATAVKACSNLVALEQGKQIHEHAMKLGLDSDLCVASGILDMYVTCGEMKDAILVFKNISEHDEVAWTAMIAGCVENGQDHHALQLYHQMKHSGIVADEFTYATIIKACSCLAALEQGKQIHSNIIKLDFASDTFVATSIIDMYAKCGCIEDSYQSFKMMDVKNITSWNAMLVGLAQYGNGEEVLEGFSKMKLEGIQPDWITYIGVLSACSHSGLVLEAYKQFESMRKDYGIEPRVEHYSCLVDTLSRAGLVKEAEELIQSMPFDASPSMYRALLGACRVKGDIEIGKRAATHLLDLEPSDSSVYVLMSNIYASAKQWEGVTDARAKMRTKNVNKEPGHSWLEVQNIVHLFVASDSFHPEIATIYDVAEDLMRKIGERGYGSFTDLCYSM